MAKATNVDVQKEGVGGAKNFFEAKVAEQSNSSRSEQEIKKEQEERKVAQEQAKQRKADFKSKASVFQ